MEYKEKVRDFYTQLDNYYDAKEYAAAKMFMEQILQEGQRICDRELIIAAGNELGGMYRASGETDNAVNTYELVLTTLVGMDLEGTVDYAMAQLNAANAYGTADLWDRALDTYESAKAIFEANAFRDDYAMAALNNNISRAYVMTGRTDDAEYAAFAALEHIMKLLPDSYPELATTYASIAEIRLAQGRAHDACVYFRKAIDIHVERLKGEDMHYAAARYGLGKALLASGDTDGARENYKYAMELVKRDFGENDNYKIIENALAGIAGGSSDFA